jgi:hypothetical protein
MIGNCPFVETQVSESPSVGSELAAALKLSLTANKVCLVSRALCLCSEFHVVL